jgi:hypothetical protein
MSVFNLPYGVVLIKGILNENQQMELANDLLHIHKLNGGNIIESPVHPNPMFTYNSCNNAMMRMYAVDTKLNDALDIQKMTNVLKFGETISDIINNAKQNDAYKNSIYKFKIIDNDETKNVNLKADSMYCVSYNNGGKCYRHADYWNSWVIAASFGLSCDFRYGKHPNESKEYIKVTDENINSLKKAYKKEDIILRINSGDVLIFNGNLLYHSVTKIYEELPTFWLKMENVNPKINRICLQFRDSRTIDNEETNTKNPHKMMEYDMQNIKQMMNGE